MSDSPRLLVISCSQAKRPTPGLLPALERYDGPAFRVLRRFLRSHSGTPSGDQLDTYVLSAQFGLISSDYAIPDYDLRMTPERASELLPVVARSVHTVVTSKPYSEALVCMSAIYQLALGPVAAEGLRVEIAHGGRAKRLSRLHDWLYGATPAGFPGDSVPRPDALKPRLRGIEVEVSRAEALDLARKALQGDAVKARNIVSWYAVIDGEWVSPKWLVSRLVPLSVSDFTTDDARRVLGRLGIEVLRA